MAKYQDEDLTHTIIAAAIEAHRTLGPGLLELAYKACLIIFNVPIIKNGIRRCVLNAEEEALPQDEVMPF